MEIQKDTVFSKKKECGRRNEERKMQNNLIFIGMPASGKSTIGVVTAKRLGYQFIDTDLMIQEREGKLLWEIIAEKGSDGFLEIEDQVNASVEAERAVIAPGGSVVYCEHAMKHYKEIGMIVYLHVPYTEIEARIQNARSRGVVLRDGQTLRELYDERCRLFDQYADVRINEDGLSMGETVEKVLAILGEIRGDTEEKQSGLFQTAPEDTSRNVK